MKRILLFLISCLLLFPQLSNAEFLSPGLYHFTEGQGDYSIFVPTINEHKMIVALHGSGERAQYYIENWLPEAASENYIVLAVNSLDKNGWTAEDVDRVLEKVRFFKKSYAVDRTLLEGASSGGQFALYLGINHYADFDAIATFMGILFGGFTQYVEYQDEAVKRRPIYMVHGDKDPMIPVIYAQLTAKFLNAQAYPTTYAEIKGMDHRHYRPENKNILKWFDKATAKK